MGIILEYINSHNESGFHCFSTKKTFLDTESHDTIVSENSDTDIIPIDTTGKIAESDQRRIKTKTISNSLIINTHPYFKYFLDGTRHTYKVDDIAIGNKIFPIIAGQIIVGCCNRPDRDTFRKADLRTKFVIALPKNFHTKGKSDDFARSYCQKLNEHLKQTNNFAKSRNIEISKILFYPTDGSAVGDVIDKNRYKNSAVAKIQTEMTDDEQLLVNQLCIDKKLNDENWLIKDGSIQITVIATGFELKSQMPTLDKAESRSISAEDFFRGAFNNAQPAKAPTMGGFGNDISIQIPDFLKK